MKLLHKKSLLYRPTWYFFEDFYGISYSKRALQGWLPLKSDSSGTINP